MLLYDSLNLIISGVHQSHLGNKSEKVKLKFEVKRFGQCYIKDVPVHCVTEIPNYYPQCVWLLLTFC